MADKKKRRVGQSGKLDKNTPGAKKDAGFWQSTGNYAGRTKPKRDPRRPTGDTSRGRKIMGRAVDSFEQKVQKRALKSGRGLTEETLKAAREAKSLGGPKPPPSTVKKPKKNPKKKR